MRLTPGLFAILLTVAVVLLTVVGFDSVAPASCSDARESLDRKLTAQAEKAYRSILAREPDSECAAKGFEAVIHRKCVEAEDRLDQGLLAHAEKAYLAVLDERPDRGCAHQGLQDVAAKLCVAADFLSAGKAADEAKKAYQALLDKPGSGVSCALRGLAALRRDEPSTRATAATNKKAQP